MTRKVIVFTAVLASLLLSPLSQAVVTNTNTQTVTANGTGSATNYTIGFDFRDNAWITVTKITNSTGAAVNIPYGAGAGKFTITGGNPGTTVVMGTAPTIGEHLVINRVIPLTQPVNYSPLSAFPASDHMKQMDTFALELQNLNSIVTGIANPVLPQPVLPAGSAYSLLGWNSTGSAVVNYTLSPSSGDVLQFNGSTWTTSSFTPSGIMLSLNGQTTKLTPAAGGTGVSNNGLLSWGFNNLTFNTSGATTLTLPTSGTLIAGTVDTGNTPNTIVGRDGTGAISVSDVWGTLHGNVLGNVTGNVTGNTSGTSSNVTGTVAIGHGGTGQTTQQSAINALVGTQTTGMVLHSDATANAKMAFLVPSDLPNGIPLSKLAQGTAGVALGRDLSGNVVEITPGSVGNVLTSDGTKWFSSAAGAGGSGTTIPIVVTTDHTIGISEHAIFVNNTGTTNLTLPDASANAGMRVIIKLISTGTLNILPTGGQLIDGNSNLNINLQFTELELIAVNGGWVIC